jgi:hypothetical protein
MIWRTMISKEAALNENHPKDLCAWLWCADVLDSRGSPPFAAAALYRSLAKYSTTWARIWWEKYLDVAERSRVFPPQTIAPSGTICSKVVGRCALSRSQCGYGVQMSCDSRGSPLFAAADL